MSVNILSPTIRSIFKRTKTASSGVPKGTQNAWYKCVKKPDKQTLSWGVLNYQNYQTMAEGQRVTG